MAPEIIERLFVLSFIRRERRDRWMTQLQSTPARRREILGRLDHRVQDLDPRRLRRLSSGEDGASLLLGYGAPETCYVMSSWEDFDRRKMDLVEAVRELVGCGMGTVISSIPGVLGLYISEPKRGVYLLEHRTFKPPAAENPTV